MPGSKLKPIGKDGSRQVSNTGKRMISTEFLLVFNIGTLENTQISMIASIRLFPQWQVHMTGHPQKCGWVSFLSTEMISTLSDNLRLLAKAQLNPGNFSISQV